MKKSTIRYLPFLLFAIGLLLGGYLQANAQTYNANVPPTSNERVYSGYAADFSMKLLAADSGKVITIEMRSSNIFGARLTPEQPTILNTTTRDTLRFRIPPVNRLLNSYVLITVGGTPRRAFNLSIDRTGRPPVGPSQLLISYAVIPGPKGKDADTTQVAALQSDVATLDSVKVSTNEYAAYVAYQTGVTSQLSGSVTAADMKAQSASAVATTALSVATSATATAANALTGVAANTRKLQTIVTVADYPGIVEAITANPGKVITVPNGSYSISTDLLLPDGTTLVGQDSLNARIVLSGAGRILLTNNSKLQQLCVTGTTTASAAVMLESSTEKRGWKVNLVRFDSTLTTGVLISSTSNNATHYDGEISQCNFDRLLANSILIIRVNTSKFLNNRSIGRPTARNFTAYGGANNEFAHNYINGGITGISHIYQASTAGRLGVVVGTSIHDNVLRGLSEENISFDCRANEPTNTAPREWDQVLSKSQSGGIYQITLAHAGWTGDVGVYTGYYACFASGSLKGFTSRITGKTNGTFTLTLNQEQYDLIQAGDWVVIGAPFLSNRVYDNDLEGASKTCMLYLFGLCYGNTVTGNTIRYTGVGEKLNGTVILAGLSVTSINGASQTGAVTASNGSRRAPSENNTIQGNTIQNADLVVNYKTFASEQTPFDSKGNVLTGNIISGGRVRIDRNEDNLFSGISTFSTVYTNTTPRPSGSSAVRSGAEITAAYTVGSVDATRSLVINSATNLRVTIPANASDAIPIYTEIPLSQSGAGQIIVSPSAGVTLLSESGKRRSRFQGATVTLRKIGVDTWTVSGDLDLALPLDGLNATAAYSVRRLTATYTGALVRVRRSSDNSETDVFADASTNTITTNSLVTSGLTVSNFAGSDSLMVTKIYDQISTNPFTNTVVSEQPRLYLSGSSKGGGGAYIAFRKDAHRMAAGTTSSAAYLHQATGATLVLRYGRVNTWDGTARTLVSSLTATSQSGIRVRRATQTTREVGVYGGGTTRFVAAPAATGTFETISYRHGSANTPNYLVTVTGNSLSGSYTTTPVVSNSANPLYIGSASSLVGTGFEFDELILFNRSISDDELSAF